MIQERQVDLILPRDQANHQIEASFAQVLSEPPTVTEGQVTPAVEVVYPRGLKQHRIPVHEGRPDDVVGVFVGKKSAVFFFFKDTPTPKFHPLPLKDAFPL